MRKVTEEELKELKDVYASINDVFNELGKIEVSIFEQKQYQEKLEERKGFVLEKIQELGKSQTELISRLDHKYGAGNLDLQTGEIT